jgi:hypothetical protein
VQSSSAVTVATIGFVNAGLLTLNQSLGVIYGANIGTTMTAWIVAIIGFNFKIETLALPMIGVGMLAKQVCSCLYVARRELDDCRADQFASMDRIQLVVVEDEQRVRALVPAFAERSAIHREGLGCTLQ